MISQSIVAFWYSIQCLGNKLGSSVIDQNGKTVFTTEFSTGANTLYMFNLRSVSKTLPLVLKITASVLVTLRDILLALSQDIFKCRNVLNPYSQIYVFPLLILLDWACRYHQ